MENSVTKEEFNNALNNINSNIVGTENNITNNLIGTANNLQTNMNGIENRMQTKITTSLKEYFKDANLPNLNQETYTCPDYIYEEFINISFNSNLPDSSNTKLSGFSVIATQCACELLNMNIVFDTKNGNGAAEPFKTRKGVDIPADIGIFWVATGVRSLNATPIETSTNKYQDAIQVNDINLSNLRAAKSTLTSESSNKEILTALKDNGFDTYISASAGEFQAFNNYEELVSEVGMQIRRVEVSDFSTTEISDNEFTIAPGAIGGNFANGVIDINFPRLKRNSNLCFYVNNNKVVNKKDELIRGLEIIAPVIGSLIRLSTFNGSVRSWNRLYSYSPNAHDGYKISGNSNETQVLIDSYQVIDDTETYPPVAIGTYNSPENKNQYILNNYRYHKTSINNYASPDTETNFTLLYENN